MSGTAASAPSRAEVNSWLERIDDVTSAIHEILNEDPMERIEKQQAREAKRREDEARQKAELLVKIKRRYEPGHFNRFANDALIDALLKEADEDPRSMPKRGVVSADSSLYTRAEIITLEEAQRLNTEARKAVQKGAWAEALALYTHAIQLHVVDEALDTTLYNNRALVRHKLRQYLGTVEDATVVLKREPTNVKALLRRATALRYVHRPVEALADIAEVLKVEPNNKEAAVQRAWLQKAESELLHSNAFGDNPAQRPRAETLCAALERLQEVKNKERGDALLDCLNVLMEGELGAAVLFTVRGGVAPTLRIAIASLQQRSSSATTTQERKEEERNLLASLRVLAIVFAQCEIATQEVSVDEVKAFVSGLADRMLDRQASEDVVGEARQHAILQCFSSFCIPYPDLVATTLSGAEQPLVALWRSEAVQSKVTLYYSLELMEALLRVCGHPSITTQLLHVPLASYPSVVVAALMESLKPDAPPPLLVVSATLALRVTTIAKCDDALPSFVSSTSFTNRLRAVIEAVSYDERAPAVRTLEALYSTVYNVLLLSRPREAYVQLWSDMNPPLGTSVLSPKVAPAPTALSAKMWAILSKCFGVDKRLPPQLASAEETVWRWLATTESTLASVNSTSDCDVFWTHAEHLTTLLATAYTMGYMKASPAAAPDAVRLLLRLMAAVKPFAEDTLMHLVAAVESHGASQGPRTASVVALGNAALLYTNIVQQSPPIVLSYALSGAAAVDVLLKVLRGARASLQFVAREAVRPERAAVVATLEVWRQHTASAQRNLAIAISRTCAVAEALKDRLRELDGFTTLLAVQQA